VRLPVSSVYIERNADYDDDYDNGSFVWLLSQYFKNININYNNILTTLFNIVHCVSLF